ncbi:MAG: glycogen/starch/alpha-glucan phosphorylase [Pseudomonadota bacterium]
MSTGQHQEQDAPTVDALKQRIQRHLDHTLGADADTANYRAWWTATCMAVNELVFDGLRATHQRHRTLDTRAVNYLSLEFLMGRLLSNNLHNLHLFDTARDALAACGHDLDAILEEEPDMALGNGGLGRLAACYLDSLATLDYPAIGYGIHYEHGLFRQEFHRGVQIERPDEWREYGNPWEVCRPESVQEIPLYGHVAIEHDDLGRPHKVWHPGLVIRGVPWDVPVVGYGGKTVNVLRLWESRASQHFDWDAFNAGAYADAQAEQTRASTVSKVLYPNDETEAGKELRLIQQYFFSACSVKDILRRFRRTHDDWDELPEQAVIQLNDTHPTVAILELLRILVDDESLDFDHAFSIVRRVFAYTNHTLLPEALETWPVRLFERVMPRHLQLLYQINEAFLSRDVDARWPGDDSMKRKLSVIEEGHERKVRMGNLCVISAFKVNGVAAIHSELIKSDLFPEFHALWPEKLTNVTNGVTPRRWLKACNPQLADLLDQTVGDGWPTDLGLLRTLEDHADDPLFQRRFLEIKQQNKRALCDVIRESTGVEVNPTALFDVQIKRLHEYKRQHLNLLHILTLYHRILANPDHDIHPRVFLFGAKAAPGYRLAKDIIYAINRVAERINQDERVGDKLKVVFLPNYRVSLAEKMIPAADVSEQISTAGKEASGTGNMKLAMNGAVTVGTLDGANIEIAEEVSADNIFIFGLTVNEVKALNAKGYNPWHHYHANAELRAVLDWLGGDFFCPDNPGALASIRHSLLDAGDPYLCLADYESYVKAHEAVDTAFRDRKRWARMAILNTALTGKFNSDRSIEDYVRGIWHLDRVDARSALPDRIAS